MKKDDKLAALADSKRTIIVGILRTGVDEPDLRRIPNEPRHFRCLCERLTRDGPIVAR
jgi:hypothetical protein